jgi:glycolate oxidase iron-sulfur subunit
MTQLPDPATRPSPTEDGHGHSHGPAAGTASVFDAFHPPSDERIDDCVHCGFCLPTCPTYVLEGNETNSPRGRIYLMKLGKAGEIPMDAEFVRNFDACLGCMACVTACPSGVRYDELIEAVRPQIERNWERTRADRAFRASSSPCSPTRPGCGPRPSSGTVYQRLGIRRLLLRLGLLQRPAHAAAGRSTPCSPAGPAGRRRPGSPAFTAAVGPRRRRVGMLSGCVQRCSSRRERCRHAGAGGRGLRRRARRAAAVLRGAVQPRRAGGGKACRPRQRRSSTASPTPTSRTSWSTWPAAGRP